MENVGEKNGTFEGRREQFRAPSKRKTIGKKQYYGAHTQERRAPDKKATKGMRKAADVKQF